jgi:hypothetical protein
VVVEAVVVEVGEVAAVEEVEEVGVVLRRCR